MTNPHGLSTGTAPARRAGAGETTVPTLIRVPTLTTPRAGHRSWPSRPRRRRRLRREVRQVAVALTIGVVLSLGVLPLLAGRTLSQRLTDQPMPSTSGDFEPVVNLSAAIEPTGPRELAHRVVLPGFIEPDDGDEEGIHGRP